MNWEDQLTISKRDSEFQQRVIAATVAFDPDLKLASAMFDQAKPDTPASSYKTNDAGEVIFFPTSADDFEQMLEMFEEMDQ